MNLVFRIRNIILKHLSKLPFYFWLYPAFRKYYFNKQDSSPNSRYLTITPNPGANIGHQLTNWLTANILAQKYSLKFAHQPVNSKWDTMLGLSNQEELYQELLKSKYCKVVWLPRFNFNKKKEEEIFQGIIHNPYKEKIIVFHLENDQGLFDLTPGFKILKTKFHNANKAPQSQAKAKLNVSIHIRRGDIVNMNNKKQLKKRWLDFTYFYNVIENLLNIFPKENISFSIYSQGNLQDFKVFNLKYNANLFINEDACKTFINMVYSDILVTSPSSFSFKAGIISNGIKITHYPWWHYVPNNSEWLRADDSGNFLLEPLKVKYTKYIK